MTKELTEVNSSNVAALGFADGILTVKYKNNRTYEYHNVPEELYNEILASDSVGQILAEKVKGQFPTEPVAKDEVEIHEEGTSDDDTTQTKTDHESVSSPVGEQAADNAPASETNEAGAEAGGDDESEVSDENDDGEGNSEPEQDGEPSQEGSGVATPETENDGGSGEPADTGGDDEGDDAPETTPDDGGDADSSGDAETAGQDSDAPSDDDGDETQEPEPEDGDTPSLGVEGDEDHLEKISDAILKHYEADKLEVCGKTEENIVIWSVLKLDEDVSDVPIEVTTGTLLELYHNAIKAPAPELDQEPNEAQSVNLNALRSELEKLGIDLQYERVEEKSGDRFWNLKATVEREDRTLNYSTKIAENCTIDEAGAAALEIAKNFVQAG